MLPWLGSNLKHLERANANYLEEHTLNPESWQIKFQETWAQLEKWHWGILPTRIEDVRIKKYVV